MKKYRWVKVKYNDRKLNIIKMREMIISVNKVLIK